MKKTIGIFSALAVLVPLIYLFLEYYRYLRHYSGASFNGEDRGWGW